MERPDSRGRRVDAGWTGLNVLLAVFAAGWVGLAFALRDECDPGAGCLDWARADAVALAVALPAMAAAAAWPRGRRPLLALATALLCVPVYHALFV